MAAFRASKLLHGHSLSAAAVRWRSQALSAGRRSQDPDGLYQQLSLRVKGHDRAVLDSFEMFVARELGLNLETVIGYSQVSRVTGSSARVYLEYIQRDLPEGVAMETAIEKIPEHTEKPVCDDSRPDP